MKPLRNRVLSMVMVMIIMVTNISYAIVDAASTKDIALSGVRATIVPSSAITKTGLTPYSQNTEVSSMRLISAPKVTSATIGNNFITIKGYVDNEEFFVTGVISAISENRCLVAYDARDKMNNFDIAFCAIEKNLDEAILYFDDENIVEDATVIKLYLKDKNFSTNENKYVMIEVFNKEFPIITDEIIEHLPVDSYEHLYWYAREFEPVNKGIKNVASTRAGNPSYIQLGFYEYNHLGMTISHYLQYRQDTNIRDVNYNGASFASATMSIVRAWTEAPLANDSSSTSSALSLRDVSISYITRNYTAIDTQTATGNVVKNGNIVTEFDYDLGIGLNGISINPSANVSWSPYNGQFKTEIEYKPHTNSVGNYWRIGTAALKSSQYLAKANNYWTVSWDYSAYEASPGSTVNAKIVFDYCLYNTLDYASADNRSDIRTISVTIDN